MIHPQQKATLAMKPLRGPANRTRRRVLALTAALAVACFFPAPMRADTARVSYQAESAAEAQAILDSAGGPVSIALDFIEGENNKLIIPRNADVELRQTETFDAIRHLPIQCLGNNHLTLSGLTLNNTGEEDGSCALSFGGSGNVLTLTENTVNTLSSGAYYAGVNLEAYASLTINGKGNLKATAGSNGAGIGADADFTAAAEALVIEDGIIEAYGQGNGAGIGNASHSLHTITITGGTLRAVGLDTGAGINCVNTDPGNSLRILGGTVTAIGGGKGAAGICAGQGTATCSVILRADVANVTATGGPSTSTVGAGAGLGGNGAGKIGSSIGSIMIVGEAENVHATPGANINSSMPAEAIGSGGYLSTRGQANSIYQIDPDACAQLLQDMDKPLQGTVSIRDAQYELSSQGQNGCTYTENDASDDASLSAEINLLDGWQYEDQASFTYSLPWCDSLTQSYILCNKSIATEGMMLNGGTQSQIPIPIIRYIKINTLKLTGTSDIDSTPTSSDNPSDDDSTGTITPVPTNTPAETEPVAVTTPEPTDPAEPTPSSTEKASIETPTPTGTDTSTEATNPAETAEATQTPAVTSTPAATQSGSGNSSSSSDTNTTSSSSSKAASPSPTATAAATATPASTSTPVPSESIKEVLRLTFGSSTLVINGETKSFPKNYGTPFLDENGNTLIPVRLLAESLGLQVQWDAQSKEIYIIKPDSDLVCLQLGQSTIQTNGKQMGTLLDAAGQPVVPYMKNDRVYLPFRALFEQVLGYQRDNIAYNATSGKVMLRVPVKN